MVRSFDPEAVANGLANYEKTVGDEFDPVVWLKDDRNVALQAGESFGIFQYEIPGVYTGHYFFSMRDRGKRAKALALEMLDEFFENYDVKVLRGLTPLQNRAARWMTRQLGFQSFGAVTTLAGPCELFIMTRDQFRNQ